PLDQCSVHFTAVPDRSDDRCPADAMAVRRAEPAILVRLGPLCPFCNRIRTLFQSTVPNLLGLCRKRVREVVILRTVQKGAIPKSVGDLEGRYYRDRIGRQGLGRT